MSTPNFIEYRFKSNETINGAIKFHNSHNLSDEILELLQLRFNELNNNIIPKPGQVVKIPLIDHTIIKI